MYICEIIVNTYSTLMYHSTEYTCGKVDNYISQVVKGEELSQICDALCYQECRRVMVNAEVVRVEFVEDPNNSCVDISSSEVQCNIQ